MNDPLKELIDFYKKNGYILVAGIFTKEECEKIQLIAEPYFGDGNIYHNIDREQPYFRQMMCDRRIVDTIEMLQGKEVDGLMTQYAYKRPGNTFANQAWNPHQDNAYPQAKDGAFITAHIFLENTDKENGGLYLYPESQNCGLLPFESVYDNELRPGNKTEMPAIKSIDIEVKQGTLLIMHGNMIHGSYANNSDRARPSFHATYISKG
ncbi:MAG: phytanoyl-CoA dioxygenase family protein, partial [bacterium]|nr:phytanoyl-CoA dioxygenase family protein [bacterium]